MVGEDIYDAGFADGASPFCWGELARFTRDRHGEDIRPPGRGCERTLERTRRALSLAVARSSCAPSTKPMAIEHHPALDRSELHRHGGYFRSHRARRGRDDGRDPARARARVSASGGARGRRPGGAGGGHDRRQPVRAEPLRRFRDGPAGARRDGDAGAAAMVSASCRSKSSSASRARKLAGIGGRFRRPATEVFRFAKVTRVHPKGLSVLSIAAQLPLASGRVAGARIAYGAMGERHCAPRRPSARSRAARSIEMRSRRPSRSPPTGPSPMDDAIASSWWRRKFFLSICAGCCWRGARVRER